jgi:hypothetical protein
MDKNGFTLVQSKTARMAAAAANAKAAQNAAASRAEASRAAAEKYKRNRAANKEQKFDTTMATLNLHYKKEGKTAKGELDKMMARKHPFPNGSERQLNKYISAELLAQDLNTRRREAAEYAAVSKWAGGKRRTRRVHKSRRKTKRRS